MGSRSALTPGVRRPGIEPRWMGHNLAGRSLGCAPRRAAGARPRGARPARVPRSPAGDAHRPHPRCQRQASAPHGRDAPRGWCDTDSSELVDARLHSYEIRQDNNDLHINLFVSKEAGEWKGWGRCVVFVDDVDALHSSLTEQGVHAPAPQDAPWGERCTRPPKTPVIPCSLPPALALSSRSWTTWTTVVDALIIIFNVFVKVKRTN
jgi:hypothetical protein